MVELGTMPPSPAIQANRATLAIRYVSVRSNGLVTATSTKPTSLALFTKREADIHACVCLPNLGSEYGKMKLEYVYSTGIQRQK